MRKATYPREIRFRWYHLVHRENKSVSEVCKIFGISRKCYYHWNKIDFTAQRPNLKSSGDHQHQPNTKLTAPVQSLIRQVKLKTNYGPERMRDYLLKELRLVVSPTIIYRFYKKNKLIRKPQKKLPWYQPLKHKLTITKPGEGVQMDVKYVYDKGRRKYQFSVFDPYTRKYFFEVFKTKESKNCIQVFLHAERYFGFNILSVQTDNGSEARGHFHTWLTKRNTPHYFIPKKSPWWNAQVERVHRTIDEEYYHNPLRQWKTPREWLQFYNYERIHSKLKTLTPHEFYLKSVTIDC
jgi:transposase InsO family protein